MDNKLILENDRSSNIELLRIISMFSIILCHFWMMFGSYIETQSHTSFFYFMRFTKGWTGAFGNSLFMLITGYFLCIKDFNLKRIIKLWFNIFSLSVIIGIFFFIFRIKAMGYNFEIHRNNSFFSVARPITIKELLQTFIPTILGKTWYASRYFVFLLFTPVLKQFLLSLNKKSHLYLIILMFILGTVTKMIPAQRLYSPNNLFYFFFAYFLSAYIRFYEINLFKSKKISLLISITTIIAIAVWNTLIYFVFKANPNLSEYKRFFNITELHMFPIWIASISLFNFFRLTHIKSSRFINSISKTTFDIYLIHCNFILGPVIWCAIFKVNKIIMTNYPWLSLFSIIGYFIIGYFVYYLRIFFIEKPLLPILYKLTGKIKL